METSPEISWPQEYIEMKRMEELLRCGICYDFIDTSVMTPCSHNYCSLCIRKYLHYKTQCPACFKTTFEKDLHANRILDDIIMYFTKIRVKLSDCIGGMDKITSNKNYTDLSCELLLNNQPTRPPRTNQCHKSSLQYKLPSNDNDQSLINNNITITEVADTSNDSNKTISPTINDKTLNLSIKNESNIDKCSGKYVQCPVCQVSITQLYINKHLDECIKRESISNANQSSVENKRKLLPKLVFNLMKDTELKKKMKQLNLPTNGDRRTLENRFQRYSTLYNAECDKKNPRSISELLKQCMDDELIEKKLDKSSLATNKIKISRNADQTVIDEANNKYLKMNAQSYQNLIESIKHRVKHETTNDNTELNDDNATTSTSNSVKIPIKHKSISYNNTEITNESNQHDSSSVSSHNNLINPMSQCSTDIKSINSKGPNKCEFIWRKVISDKLKSNDIKLNDNMNSAITNDNNQMNKNETIDILYSIDDNKKSDCNNDNYLSINNSTFACHTMRKRNHYSYDDNKNDVCDIVLMPDVNINATSSSTQLYQNDNNTNINNNNDIDNNQSVESDNCTMKRRRRQKQIAISPNKLINPPSRPARKRDSSIITTK